MEVRPGHEIAVVIAAHTPDGTLEWASVRTIHNESDNLKYPFTGFRLSQPSGPLIAALADAVSTFSGQEKWHLARAPSKRENYIIKPEFVDALAQVLTSKSLRLRTDFLAELAPDRCRAANADVPKLARHIGERLQHLGHEARWL